MLHYWDDQSLANVVVLISHTDWLWALWEQQRFTLWVSDSLTSVKHPKPQQTTQPNGNDTWLVRLSRSVKGYHSANLQPITDPPAHCPRPKAPIQWHILYFLAGQGLSFLFFKIENQESLNFFLIFYTLHWPSLLYLLLVLGVLALLAVPGWTGDGEITSGIISKLVCWITAEAF